MATIGKVRAVFTASTSGLTGGVSQATSSLKRMEAGINSLKGRLGGLASIQGAMLFGSIASGASRAVSSLVAMGSASANVIDDVSKLSARLGMTYAELAGLSLAGDLAGVSMETIGKAATKADIAFVKAAGGSDKAIAAFEGIGLSVESLNGLSAADRFSAITEAISKLPTAAERAAAAVQIFGNAGSELLPLFAGGAAGIKAATDEAERFGLALTNAQGQDVEKMNDSFTRAQQAIKGVVGQIVAYLAPAIEAVTTQFSNLIGSVGGANIGQAIGDGILQGARFLAVIGDYIIQNFGSTFTYLANVATSWAPIFDIGMRVGDALMAAARVMQLTFLVIGGALSPIAEGLLQAASLLGSSLGFDVSGIDKGIKVIQDFQAGVGAQIAEAGTAWAENAGNALLGRAEEAGPAIAGPLVTGLDAAISAAQASAGMIDEATATTLQIEEPPTLKVDQQSVKDAVHGIDSRSREGIAEMFRIMRGDQGNTTAEKQLKVLERIEANTDDDAIDVEENDLAPAAGV